MSNQSADIAIVGMACMFPKADDLSAYWRNIVRRVDAIEEVPPDRWNVDDFFSPDRLAPDRTYSKWGGFLGSRVFDPMKYRIPPASLKSIEPVQLLALEVAWQAMEDAGYHQREFPRERTGVLFACAGSHELGSSYNFRTMMRHFLPKVEGLDPETRERIFESLEEQLPEWTEDSFPGFLMNVVAGRIARELNLNGPNYVVDAACAASLAALHAAIEQLRSGTSDMMLVGAADATNNPFCFMSFSKTHALSPRGRSRPFDETGDGIGLGEGIGVVILKRLADAERDGDKIYAVIRGIGSSSDGKNKSLTAPYPPGQIRAVERAYQDAGFSPASVSLVEAHGTGTVVGDSAEITTLTEVFGSSSQEKQFAAVGSVKSMIGHTKTVAGIASLIKTAMAVHQRVLPATIGVEQPTTKVDFTQSPFYVNTETRPWLREIPNEPRRAGVSAFGFGGTNFHVVLEEHAPKNAKIENLDFVPRSAELFVFERSNRQEILAAIGELDGQLKEVESPKIEQLAYSVHCDEAKRGKGSRECRLALVAGSIAELKQKLQKTAGLLANRASLVDPSGVYYSEAAPVPQEQVCFLYPGQGSQTVNMMRDLVISCRWSHELFERANEVLAPFLAKPLSRYIFPPPVFSDQDRQKQFEELSDTRVAQPAIGVIGMFSTELMRRFGVRPGVSAGHSFGEHVALQAAGSLTADELLLLSAERGKLCEAAGRVSPGGMAAVRAGSDKAQALINELNLPQLYLANLNSPEQTIIAGLVSSVETAVEEFNRRGMKAKRIPVPAAFHTPMLQNAAKEFVVHLERASFAKRNVVVYSNTTAQVHPDDPAEVRHLLTRHLAEPVLFEAELRSIYADGARVFVEMGPGKVLTGLVGSILKDQPHAALAMDAPGRESWTQFGHLLAQLEALGLPVAVDAWYVNRGLSPLSVSEFVTKAHAETHPKPSAWILHPNRSEPVTPLPAKRSRTAKGKSGVVSSPARSALAPAAHSTSEKTSEQPSASTAALPPIPPSPTPVAPAGVPPVSVPGNMAGAAKPAPVSSSNVNIARNQPKMTQMLHETNETTSAPSNAGVEIFAQFHATTRALLEMQQSQNRLFERYLETQERMLFHCAQGISLSTVGLSVTAVAPSLAAPVAPPAPVARPAASVPVVAPVPVVAARAPIAMPAAPVPAVAKAAPAPAPVAAAPAAKPVLAEPAPAERIERKSEPAAAPVASNGPPPTDVFRKDLLEIVSERTGYPVDMLDEDLPLEAGLGIDSIKTVEIFSNLKDYHPFFRVEDQDEEEALTEFTSLKTLRDIINSYDRRRAMYKAPASNGATHVEGNGVTHGVERFSVTAVEAPAEGNGAKKNFLGSTSS